MAVAGWEVICMGLREIGAQICPLILLAQMPISAEQPLGYLKLGEIINPQQLWSRLRRAAAVVFRTTLTVSFPKIS